MRWYLYNVFAGASHLLNSLLCGSPQHSFCARVHWSRENGDFWAFVPLPEWFEEHCRWSAGAEELSRTLEQSSHRE